MEFQVRIWSKAYCPIADTDNFSICVDIRLWRNCMRQENHNRMFISIKNPTGPIWVAPMGSPVDNQIDEENLYDIYVPLWMIDSGKLPDEGHILSAEALSEEAFPEATKIVLRVIDSAFYSSTIKEELERALSHIGVIRQESTLPIPLKSLDGFGVDIYVSHTEPANVVLCHGNEVVVEFEEPIDQIQESIPTPSVPSPRPTEINNSNVAENLMVPFETATTKFVGQGNILGSSNAHVPEWRRGLPPPPRR